MPRAYFDYETGLGEEISPPQPCYASKIDAPSKPGFHKTSGLFRTHFHIVIFVDAKRKNCRVDGI